MLINLIPWPLRKRLFVAYALSRRAMTLGVRALVRDGEGRVLLVRHTYVDGWFLPGGGVERGQTLADAMVAELREEANVELTGPPRQFHTYRNPRTSRFDYVTLFICEDWRQTGPRQPDNEIAETGFFPLDALPDGTTEPTRARLAEVLNGEPVADIW